MISVFVVVCLVFIGFGLSAIPRDNMTISLNDSGKLTARSVVHAVSQNVRGDVLKITKSSAKNGLTSTGNVAYSASYYSTNDGKYQTQPDKLYGMAVVGELDEMNQTYESLGSFLKANSFVLQESYNGQEGESFIQQSQYVSSDVVCHISESSLLETEINALSVGIGCADIASYKRVAAQVEPYYDLFAEANPKQAAGLYIDTPTISEGKTGYRNAVVLVDDYAALFYKTPSGDWKYFTSVSQMPYCSFYNTTDLRKSFAGQACYDLSNRKQVTVKA